MRPALYTLALSALATPAQAETLVYLGPGAGGIELYVDRDTLRTLPPPNRYRPFSAVQVWVVYDTSKVRRSGTRTERSLLSFDCMRRKRSILAYQKIKTNGGTVHDWKGADIAARYEAISSSSFDESVLNWACSGGRIIPDAARPPAIGQAEEED